MGAVINDDSIEISEWPSSLPVHFTCNICNKERHMNHIDVIKWYSSDGCCEWSERVIYCNDSDKCKERAKRRMIDDKERVAYFGNLKVGGERER